MDKKIPFMLAAGTADGVLAQASEIKYEDSNLGCNTVSGALGVLSGRARAMCTVAGSVYLSMTTVLESVGDGCSFTLDSAADLYAVCTEATSHFGVYDEDGLSVSGQVTDEVGTSTTLIYKNMPAGTYNIDHDPSQGTMTLYKTKPSSISNDASAQDLYNLYELITGGYNAGCHFQLMIGGDFFVCGTADLVHVSMPGASYLRASLFAVKSATEPYVITATWILSSGATTTSNIPTITVTRIESGLVIDENITTTEND